MHKSATLLAACLTCLATLSAAQDAVTFYGASLKPAPSDQPSELNKLDPEELVNAIAPLGGKINSASAVGIDVSGRTIYVGVHEYSVTISTASGQLTTVTLPTPTSEAGSPSSLSKTGLKLTERDPVTLFARPTGFYYRKYGVTVSNNQEIYEGTLNYFCEHDVEQNSAVDDAIVVCRKELVGEGRMGMSSVPRTEIEATTVGNAVPIATITNAPDGADLPTLGLGPSGFSTIIQQEPTDESGDAKAKGMGLFGLVVSSLALLVYHVL
ncbi:hypothetical protein BKA70DRAFT_1489942 [Coprinopsis sp. MPI-PUGE-AT-0042]|nr:hypothetical protein BKA70DRAFT_1489942 [Coprinopsis sp. MPI-PUGE-AT-0042]